MSAFFTQTQLKKSLKALDVARQTFHCTVPRKDAEGNTHFNDNQVAYGRHDSAFIQVNPETGEIRCGACAGELDSTTKPKVKVEDRTQKGRFHLVSK